MKYRSQLYPSISIYFSKKKNGGLDSTKKIPYGEFNQNLVFTTYDQEADIQSQIRQRSKL